MSPAALLPVLHAGADRLRPVLVSQRVDVLADRGERRDALDQRLAAWLTHCGYLAMPVPNRPQAVPALVAAVRPVGIVLSGGNDLAVLGGDAPERDATEAALLGCGLPVFGICRGLQLLVAECGGRLQRVEGHAGTRHLVHAAGWQAEVNSFHHWGVQALPPVLLATAHAADGSVEAVRHTRLPMAAVMWHPEREARFADHDDRLLHQTFNQSETRRCVA